MLAGGNQDKRTAIRSLCETYLDVALAGMGIIDRLMGKLKELMRKQDYRFSNETLGDEKDSWIRGIRKMSGSPLSE